MPRRMRHLRTLLLRIFSNQLDELRSDGQGGVVKRRYLLVVPRAEVRRVRAQQSQQLLDVLDLREDLRLRLRVPLELVGCRILQLLDVVQREDARLPSQRAFPPVLVHRLEHGYDVALPELQLPRLRRLEVVQGANARDRRRGRARRQRLRLRMTLLREFVCVFSFRAALEPLSLIDSANAS